MEWHAKQTFRLLLFLGFGLGFILASGETTEAIANTTYSVILCPIGSTDDGRIATLCSQPECASTEFNCTVDVSDLVGCIDSPPNVPSAVSTVFPLVSPFYAAYYLCSDGLSWISGRDSPHLSVCSNGVWSPILDNCVPDNCDGIPDNCADLIDYGFQENKFYNIYGLRQLKWGPVQVFCELDETESPGDIGWTTIFFNFMTFHSYNLYAAENTGSMFNQILKNEKPFFVGIEALSNLNRDWNGNIRPLVMQFLMISNGPFYHATYDNVIISATNGNEAEYTLESVGNYHGNAGDAFSQNVNLEYRASPIDSNFGWFTHNLAQDTGTIISLPDSTWSKLVDTVLTRVQVRVRPKSYDTANACPTFVAMDPPDKGLWPATYVDFPSHRAIDASITFACLDDYVIENPDDNSLQTSGTITCQQSGWKAPAWNGTLNLPCIMKCPANYVRGYGTDETCYRVSSTQVSKGLFGAVRSCLDEGATLAVNPNISYFKNLDLVQAGNYLTAHGQWGSATSITPTLLASCTGACLPTSENHCLAVDDEGLYSSLSCKVQSKYICATPGICPSGYSWINRRCYKPVQNTVTIQEAIHTCKADGGALVVPARTTDVEFLRKEFPVPEALMPITLVVSVPSSPIPGPNLPHEQLFIWQNSYLAPSENFSQVNFTAIILQNSDIDSLWRIVRTSREPFLINKLLDLDLMSAICEYPGQMECWESPPLSHPRQSREIYGSLMGDNTTYTCDPGYVVNDAFLVKEAQVVRCYGQSGGWRVDPLFSCTLSPCNLAPPVPLANMNYTYNTTNVLGDVAEYSCNPGFVVNETTTVYKQDIQCYGNQGEWSVDTLRPCLHMEVCLDDSPVPATGLYDMNYGENHTYFGGNVFVVCTEGMATSNGLTIQNITCSQEGILNGTRFYGFQPSTLENCTVCASEPLVENATSDWSLTAQYVLGDSVTATCLAGYKADINITSINVFCTPSGWNVTAACYPVCMDPPVPLANMSMNSTIDKKVGSTLKYVCDDGLYIPAYELYPQLINETFVTCNETRQWEVDVPSLECVSLCVEAPFVENATVAWDITKMWKIRDAVSASCIANHEFSFGVGNHTLNCTITGWEVVPGCYEACSSTLPVSINMTISNHTSNTVGTLLEYSCMDGQSLRLTQEYQTLRNTTVVICETNLMWVAEGPPLICEMPVMTPPVANAVPQAILQMIPGPYYIGQTMTYSCPGDMMAANGETSTIAVYNTSGWHIVDPSFSCYNVTSQPYSHVPLNAVIVENGPYHVNQSIEIRCEEGKISDTGKSSTFITYTLTGWVPSEPDFDCFPMFSCY